MRSVGKFYDDINFPRGFNRSGLFTVNESMLLENYGRTLRGLIEKELEPVSESEQEFLAEMLGEQEVESKFSKCWLKYIEKTTRKKMIFTLCASPRKGISSYDYDGGRGDEDNDLYY